MSKPIARETLLEQLPVRALRRIARGFGLNQSTAGMSRAELRSRLAHASHVTTEAMVSMLTEAELANAARRAGLRPLPENRREMKARLLGTQVERALRNATPPAPEPVAAFTADTRVAAHLFHDYEGDGASRVFVGHAIPLERLGAASESFPIPNYEHIMVFYDNSLLGNGSTGFAIGEHGIYWGNPLGLPSGRTSLAWREFVERPVRREGEHEIHVGDDATMHITFLDTHKLLHLLKELQAALRATAAQTMPVIAPNMRAVARCCRRYNAMSLQSFHFRPRISKRKLAQARTSFLIPDFDNVAVLCDNTVFGGCERGFALGEHGIYWRNAPGAQTSRHALTWPELALAHVRTEQDELITLGDNVHIHVEFLPGELGAALFHELQVLVRDATDAMAQRQPPRNGSRRRKQHWDGRAPALTPVFVARARDELMRARIPEQLGDLLWQSADRSLALTASAVSGVLRGLKLRR